VAECVFCAIVEGRRDQAIVTEDEHTVTFLDIRPAFKGHLLVVPHRHYETLAELPPELVGPLFSRVLWPRRRYSGPAEEADYARRLSDSMQEGAS
jgi:galactose-1-phosphate uridylyltransferase